MPATVGRTIAALSAAMRRRCANYSRRLPGGRQLADNDDVAAVLGDVAAGAQVLEDPADHLARCADAIGNALLRQPLAHATLPVRARIGEVGEEPHDACVDVLERQALDALGRLPHRADELSDQMKREIRV